jgi:alpha-ribazole phosphatase
MTCELYMVRHAPVQVRGVCYGQWDVPTELSTEEASRRVLPQLVGLSIDAIWTSPWARTEPVARTLSEHLSVPLHVDSRLSEIAMGRWEGRSFEAIEREEPEAYHRWMERWREEATPGGESLPSFVERVRAWFEQEKAGTCLVVSHAGVIRTLRALRRGVSYEEVVTMPVAHLSVEALGIPV